LCIAGFMTFLDVSIVNVSLPTIDRELHITVTVLQYVVTTSVANLPSSCPRRNPIPRTPL
jgi:MFS family permease